MKTTKSINLLIADDDPDDRMMTQAALEESYLLNNLYFVENGQELMDFLKHLGRCKWQYLL